MEHRAFLYERASHMAGVRMLANRGLKSANGKETENEDRSIWRSISGCFAVARGSSDHLHASMWNKFATNDGFTEGVRHKVLHGAAPFF